jgi:hypothetical protein
MRGMARSTKPTSFTHHPCFRMRRGMGAFPFAAELPFFRFNEERRQATVPFVFCCGRPLVILIAAKGLRNSLRSFAAIGTFHIAPPRALPGEWQTNGWPIWDSRLSNGSCSPAASRRATSTTRTPRPPLSCDKTTNRRFSPHQELTYGVSPLGTGVARAADCIRHCLFQVEGLCSPGRTASRSMNLVLQLHLDSFLQLLTPSLGFYCLN